jgi:hypothetical protein
LDLIASLPVELFNCDLVIGGNAVLLAASLDNCVHIPVFPAPCGVRPETGLNFGWCASDSA